MNKKREEFGQKPALAPVVPLNVPVKSPNTGNAVGLAPNTIPIKPNQAVDIGKGLKPQLAPPPPPPTKIKS